jgi:hypothetical protein
METPRLGRQARGKRARPNYRGPAGGRQSSKMGYAAPHNDGRVTVNVIERFDRPQICIYNSVKEPELLPWGHVSPIFPHGLGR